MKCAILNFNVVFILCVLLSCEGQRPPSLPISFDSLRPIIRSSIIVPKGRYVRLDNIFIHHYGSNSTTPTTYPVRNIKRLLSDPSFDVKRPTLLYAHGYVELVNDESVIAVVSSYLRRGGYNILALDWSNMAFRNYAFVALDITAVGEESAKAMAKLLQGGLSLEGLHFLGHSMGAHVMAAAASNLAARGYKIPRLTGLDPAYPGFYPPLLSRPMSRSDAVFVDVIHTDGGGYGAPDRTGHADFWPNGGQAKQPGCLSATVPLTSEDFCSHWRSWAFWAEAVVSGGFVARKCSDYDTFLRGQCREAPLVPMGIETAPNLRGNFYFRTGAKEPYGLSERGTD